MAALALRLRQTRRVLDAMIGATSAAAATSRYSHPAVTTCSVVPTRCMSSKVPKLTSEQPSYRHLQRGQFASLTDDDMDYFRAVVSSEPITDDLDGYNTDWLGKYRGQSRLILRPKTTKEMSDILAHCHRRRIAVSFQGGNTGLVGGSVPLFDEVIVSTSLMNEVMSVDTVSGILTCQAGCVLATLDDHLADYGLMMPLDLGAKGSCQIGGNVATNAGGVRLLRYGSLHGTVLGLEAVLADGTVVDTLTSLRKDNTGYDLKQLFIGSEGTLGAITAVSIKVATRPAAENVAFLACHDYQSVQRAFMMASSQLGEILSAFEFIDEAAMDCVQTNSGVPNPLSDSHPFYVLVETHGSNMQHDGEKLEAFLSNAMEEGIVTDGVLAQDASQMASIWEARERITEALTHDGTVYKYDVSLPVPSLYSLVEAMRERVQDSALRCIAYGHLGDGNLHLNITSKEPDEHLLGLIEPFVYEFTAKHRGSISAEHGLGLMKPHHIHYSKPKAAVDMMRKFKAILDPHGILNPYKTIPMH